MKPYTSVRHIKPNLESFGNETSRQRKMIDQGREPCTVTFAKQMSLVDAVLRVAYRLAETQAKRTSPLADCAPTRGSRIRPTVSGCTVMAIMMMVIEALWVFRKTDAGVCVEMDEV